MFDWQDASAIDVQFLMPTVDDVAPGRTTSKERVDTLLVFPPIAAPVLDFDGDDSCAMPPDEVDFAAVGASVVTSGQGLTCGIIGLVNKGQPRTRDDWGVLSAWGWGMSKVLDYERFLTGFISSSGQSGAKLHRRKYGEAIENIAATNEYHWMAGNYLEYAGRRDRLPVDAHQLMAMVAPRPVFLSTGNGPDLNPDGSIRMLDPNSPTIVISRGPVELQAANINDAWVDPKGTFLAGVGAGPVYRLLGKRALGTDQFPALETGVMDGDIAFRQHAGGHTPGPNWPVFLEFADRYFR